MEAPRLQPHALDPTPHTAADIPPPPTHKEARPSEYHTATEGTGRTLARTHTEIGRKGLRLRGGGDTYNAQEKNLGKAVRYMTHTPERNESTQMTVGLSVKQIDNEQRKTKGLASATHDSGREELGDEQTKSDGVITEYIASLNGPKTETDQSQEPESAVTGSGALPRVTLQEAERKHKRKMKLSLTYRKQVESEVRPNQDYRGRPTDKRRRNNGYTRKRKKAPVNTIPTGT